MHFPIAASASSLLGGLDQEEKWEVGWIFPGNLRKDSSIGSWEPVSNLRRREVRPWGAPGQPMLQGDPQPGWPLGPMGNGSGQPGSPWPGYILWGARTSPHRAGHPQHTPPGADSLAMLGCMPPRLLRPQLGGWFLGGGWPGLLKGWLLLRPPGGGGAAHAGPGSVGLSTADPNHL